MTREAINTFQIWYGELLSLLHVSLWNKIKKGGDTWDWIYGYMHAWASNQYKRNKDLMKCEYL